MSVSVLLSNWGRTVVASFVCFSAVCFSLISSGLVTALLDAVTQHLVRHPKLDRFKPDLYIEDGYDLSAYGCNAKILHLPGHSKGSLGILTTDGDLFCGDLLKNSDKPDFHWLIFDVVAANASVEKLKSLTIHTIYPGHGKPFPMELFIKNH